MPILVGNSAIVPFDESNIKNHLDKVVEKICQKIAVPGFKSMCFIAGGSIASLAQQTPVNDYDVFFKEKKFFDEVATFIKHNNLYVIAETNNAITLRVGGAKVQFIGRAFGTAGEIIRRFDYEHTMNFYCIDTRVLYVGNASAVLNKLLIYNQDCESPLGSLHRYKKFLNRGYRIDSNNLHKLLEVVIEIKGIKMLILMNQLYDVPRNKHP